MTTLPETPAPALPEITRKHLLALGSAILDADAADMGDTGLKLLDEIHRILAALHSGELRLVETKDWEQAQNVEWPDEPSWLSPVDTGDTK